MPSLLGQLTAIVGAAGRLTHDRPFQFDGGVALLSELVHDALLDARTITLRRLDGVPRLAPLAERLLEMPIDPGALELLWHQFSFFIECGPAPEFVVDKRPPQVVDNYYFALRNMYLRGDANLMRQADPLLSPGMQSALLFGMASACSFFYFHALAEALYEDRATRPVLQRWLVQCQLDPEPDDDEAALCTAFAASLLFQELIATHGGGAVQQSWAAAVLVWMHAIPLVAVWMRYEDQVSAASFRRFLESTIGTAQSSLSLSRLAAVLRVNYAMNDRPLSSTESLQNRLIQERALANVGFLLKAVNLDYEGRLVESIPRQYLFVHDALSSEVRRAIGPKATEPLLVPGVQGSDRLHYYENPYLAAAVRHAVADFQSRAVHAIAAVAEMTILGSTVPLLQYNAMVVVNPAPNWPTAVVMLSEGLCDILWHSFSFIASTSIFTGDAEDFARYRAAPRHQDLSRLAPLHDLLLAKAQSRLSLYEKPVHNHTAAQKALLAIQLNIAYAFVAGHEIAHILYKNPDTREEMRRYFSANAVGWPEGPTAEETVCDLFSALILLRSDDSAERRAVTFTSLLWATSLFSIPQWLAWRPQADGADAGSFAAFLQSQGDGTHPPGTRRFSNILKLVKAPLLDPDKKNFVLLSGTCIFHALGVDPRLVLQGEDFDWPAPGAIERF
jgi:hypothetical protein